MSRLAGFDGTAGARTVRRGALAAAAVFAAALPAPEPCEGQWGRVAATVGGAAGGAVAGVYLTTAVYVTKARTGSFLYSMHDLVGPRWETFPIVAAPVAGAVLGATSPERLGGAAVWGLAGFAAGAGLGYALGSWLGDSPEEKWAGGIIGSGAGLLAGMVFGAIRAGDTSEGEERVLLRFSVPWPGGAAGGLR